MSTVTTGRFGEAIAAGYLELLGYEIRRRNLRFGPREIDLVATRGRELLFVEVKLRSSERAGGARHAVGARKRADILRATGPSLGRLVRVGWRPRYDLVEIQLDRARGTLVLRHRPGAFAPPSSFVS